MSQQQLVLLIIIKREYPTNFPALIVIVCGKDDRKRPSEVFKQRHQPRHSLSEYINVYHCLAFSYREGHLTITYQIHAK